MNGSIINMKAGDSAFDSACETAYSALREAGLDPLYDDTNNRAGAKFATADLIGLPWQLIVGPRGIAKGELELKNRSTGERIALPLHDSVKLLVEWHGS